MTTKTTQKGTDRKSRKKIVLACTALVVGGGLLIGGTSANLTKLVSDGSTSNRISSGAVAFDFQRTAMEPIQADISLDTIDQAPFTFRVTNTGAISAHAVFAPDSASLAGLDMTNPLLDLTRVSVNVSVGDTPNSRYSYEVTLREFLTTAIYFDKPLEPGESVQVQGHITAASSESWTTEEPVAAINQAFGTSFLFSQDINGDSPVAAYAKSMGISSPDKPLLWTFPASELAALTS
jgi:hypothetical protein